MRDSQQGMESSPRGIYACIVISQRVALSSIRAPPHFDCVPSARVIERTASPAQVKRSEASNPGNTARSQAPPAGRSSVTVRADNHALPPRTAWPAIVLLRHATQGRQRIFGWREVQCMRVGFVRGWGRRGAVLPQADRAVVSSHMWIAQRVSQGCARSLVDAVGRTHVRDER